MSSSAQSFVARLPATSLSSSTTLPVLQLAAATGKPLEIVRLEISQEGSTTSANAAVEMIYSTATAPGTLTAGNSVVAKNNPSSGAQGFTLTGSGFSGSLTGTQNVLKRQGWNVLNGYLYLPVPEERFEVPGGGFLWIRLPVLPASTTVDLEIAVIERG